MYKEVKCVRLQIQSEPNLMLKFFAVNGVERVINLNKEMKYYIN